MVDLMDKRLSDPTSSVDYNAFVTSLVTHHLSTGSPVPKELGVRLLLAFLNLCTVTLDDLHAASDLHATLSSSHGARKEWSLLLSRVFRRHAFENLPRRPRSSADFESRSAASRALSKATEHARNFVEVNRRYGTFYPNYPEICEELVAAWGLMGRSRRAGEVYTASKSRGVVGRGAFAKLIYAMCDSLEMSELRAARRMHDAAKGGEGDDDWSWDATRALVAGYAKNQSYHSTSFPGPNDPLRAHLWKQSYKLFKQLPASEVERDGSKALKTVLHALYRATVHHTNAVRGMSARRKNQVWQRPLVIHAALSDVQAAHWHLFDEEACLTALKCHANLARTRRAEELLEHVGGGRAREEAEEAIAEARGRTGEWEKVKDYVRDRAGRGGLI